jgi:uncharacterized protein
MWSVLIPGFMLGLISSFHCVGMCGPIALSLPLYNLPAAKKRLTILCYHFGRISTYSIMGLLFGLFGRQMHLSGLQSGFSIISGLLILVAVFFYFVRKKALEPAFTRAMHVKVQLMMSKYLRSKTITGFFMLGMFNGLLPCGMVYIAIAGALNTSSLLSGSLFMAMYGFGTLPALLALSSFSFYFNISVRNRMKSAMPYVMVFIGIVLILRGMNLGIPYISPLINRVIPGEVIICH